MGGALVSHTFLLQLLNTLPSPGDQPASTLLLMQMPVGQLLIVLREISGEVPASVKKKPKEEGPSRLQPSTRPEAPEEK